MTASSDLTSTTIVVTGASDGIGAVAARTLHERGARVLVVGRSASKTEAVARSIGAEHFVADYARFDDVRRLAAELEAATDHVDVLLNNAGGTFKPSQRTPDGHEPNFQINHLSPFLLTHLLRGKLGGATSSRVVNVSSIGNLAGKVDLAHLDRGRLELRAYGTSKLMNILFTRGLAARWSADQIASVAVHPGPVATSFGRDSAFVGLVYRTPLKRLATITPEQGATPLVDVAVDRSADAVNGRYFSRHQPDGLMNPQAKNGALVDGLWEASLRYVGL